MDTQAALELEVRERPVKASMVNPAVCLVVVVVRARLAGLTPRVLAAMVQVIRLQVQR
jgi:hypothetical protein